MLTEETKPKSVDVANEENTAHPVSDEMCQALDNNTAAELNPHLLLARRIFQLLLGLFLYGIGSALMMRAYIGVAPWDVLGQGLSRLLGIPFGFVTIGVGVIVMLFWIPLRQMPGWGTLLNVLLVGPSAEVGLALIPADLDLVYRIILFPCGLVTIAIATGLYIGARFGSGPRDGLMTGIHLRLGWPIWVGRTCIEVSVLVAGWLLGGNVGVGTVLFAVFIGPLCGFTIPFLRTPEPCGHGTAVTEEGQALATGADDGDGRDGEGDIESPSHCVGGGAGAVDPADTDRDGGHGPYGADDGPYTADGVHGAPKALPDADAPEEARPEVQPEVAAVSSVAQSFSEPHTDALPADPAPGVGGARGPSATATGDAAATSDDAVGSDGVTFVDAAHVRVGRMSEGI